VLKDPTDVRLANDQIKLGSLLKVAKVYQWGATTSYRLDTAGDGAKEDMDPAPREKGV